MVTANRFSMALPVLEEESATADPSRWEWLMIGVCIAYCGLCLGAGFRLGWAVVAWLLV